MADTANNYSTTSPFDWGKHLPGMDFLKQMQNSTLPASGGAAPLAGGLGGSTSGWAVPTLNVQELEQRIKDLESVLFWLEQNVMGVKTTIQALQVQKMTLSTLQGMNVNFQDLATQLQQSMVAAVQPSNMESKQSSSVHADTSTVPDTAEAAPAAPVQDGAPPINPTAWWNALTEQFQQVWQQAASSEAINPSAKVTSKTKSKRSVATAGVAKNKSSRSSIATKTIKGAASVIKKQAAATRKKTSV